MSEKYLFSIEHIKRPNGFAKLFGGIFMLVAVGVGIGAYILGASLFKQHNINVAARLLPFDVNGISSVQAGDIIMAEPVHIESPELPQLIAELPSAASFTAHSILVKDAETGMTLYQKQEYDTWPIASITKLMSALVLLEKDIPWTASTTVVDDALVDTHMYGGDTYSFEELWNTALIGSSNKAIMTLADKIGWERAAFVSRMNERATELGMGDTHFVEPTGLDSGNVSTASDVAVLLEEVSRHDRIRETLITPEYEIYSAERNKAHHLWNTNWLLLGWVPHTFEAIALGKTGYIDASLYNFAVTIVGAGGRTLDVVILGANHHEARFTEARDIAEAVFAAYVWPEQEGYEH